MKDIQSINNLIINKGRDLGFSAIGFSKASFLDQESLHLKSWLDNGFHGEMHYMKNHFNKRVDPTKLVENAKSVISVLFNYYPQEKQKEGTYKISKYAYGKDYHFVVKDKLFELLDFINSEICEVSGRAFVDSAPVMEKTWAAKSGLGWIGKNTNLISKEFGSFFFIGELIIDLELNYNTELYKNYCGNCTKCIDACPTEALEPYELDARRCISYLTIEKKGEIPEEFRGKWNDWIFGCDACQDVCPWNQRLKPHNEESFKISDLLKNMDKSEWEEFDKPAFKKVFKKSSAERTKFEGLKRNIEFLK